MSHSTTKDYRLFALRRDREAAIDLLAELYKAACGSPHLHVMHRELKQRVQSFLFRQGRNNP